MKDMERQMLTTTIGAKVQLSICLQSKQHLTFSAVGWNYGGGRFCLSYLNRIPDFGKSLLACLDCGMVDWTNATNI